MFELDTMKKIVDVEKKITKLLKSGNFYTINEIADLLENEYSTQFISAVIKQYCNNVKSFEKNRKKYFYYN